MIPALGNQRNGNPEAMRRAVVLFDADVFAEIRELAIGNKLSFAETVRMLVDWGLESVNGPHFGDSYGEKAKAS